MAVRIVTVLALPIALIVLLRAAPSLDARWEDQPAHFWIVLAAGVLNAGLALAVSEAGRRRKDARLLLIGLAFLASAGFLGLHALATPGVLLEKGNAGFVLATPVGLVVAGLLAAASAVEYPLRTALAIVRHARALVGAVLALLALWAVLSLAELPPLRRDRRARGRRGRARRVRADRRRARTGSPPSQYFRIAARRGSKLAFAIAFAFALLAESLVIVLASLTTSWQLSWWEWHVLMAISFFTIAAAAQREWFEERFSALYLDETLAGHREVTVLFADLSGFTPFSEANGPEAVHRMLVTYFGELAPMIVDDFDGEVQDFVGDQIFAIFNKRGDQPDHALRGRAEPRSSCNAAPKRSASPTGRIFRCGVNTGPVLAGVVGDRGHRIHGVFGDTVNLGSRLEGQAPPGEIVIAATTRDHLPDAAQVEPLPPLPIKGKAEPGRGVHSPRAVAGARRPTLVTSPPFGRAPEGFPGLPVVVALERLGQLVLVHLRAPGDVRLASVRLELRLRLAGVDAAVGLLRPVARRGAALLGLRVRRPVVVLELPVVALLLGDVLDRRPRRPMGALLAVVLLLGAVERLGVGVLHLLGRALQRAR